MHLGHNAPSPARSFFISTTSSSRQFVYMLPTSQSERGKTISHGHECDLLVIVTTHVDAFQLTSASNASAMNRRGTRVVLLTIIAGWSMVTS